MQKRYVQQRTKKIATMRFYLCHNNKNNNINKLCLLSTCIETTMFPEKEGKKKNQSRNRIEKNVFCIVVARFVLALASSWRNWISRRNSFWWPADGAVYIEIDSEHNLMSSSDTDRSVQRTRPKVSRLENNVRCSVFFFSSFSLQEKFWKTEKRFYSLENQMYSTQNAYVAVEYFQFSCGIHDVFLLLPSVGDSLGRLLPLANVHTSMSSDHTLACTSAFLRRVPQSSAAATPESIAMFRLVNRRLPPLKVPLPLCLLVQKGGTKHPLA